MKRLVFTILITAGLSSIAYAKYSGGSGTVGAPYKIATAVDLLALATNINDYDANFVLTADINLGSSGTFTTAVIAPDTNSSNYTFEGTPFTGVFNGTGHKILNLSIVTGGAGNDHLGLFGCVKSGEIENLRLENVRIISGNDSYRLGGLVGFNDDGNIINCSSAGDVNGGDNSQFIGGLVGYNGGSIHNCYSTGTVAGYSYLGGLAGENYKGDISNCYSEGAVSSGVNSGILGGLVGENWEGDINNCYSAGAVSGGDNSEIIGGLVGYNNGGISDCYSTGTVTGHSYLGGLVGYNDYCSISNCYSTGAVNGGTGSDNLGGLVGMNYGTISNCYSKGAVTGGANYLGGLIGSNTGSIIACFWDNQTSRQSYGVGSGSSAGVMGKSTAEMMTQSTFTNSGWDFAKTAGNPAVWGMPTNGPPRLVWGCIDTSTLINYIGQWKRGDISMSALMNYVMIWKYGWGC